MNKPQPTDSSVIDSGRSIPDLAASDLDSLKLPKDTMVIETHGRTHLIEPQPGQSIQIHNGFDLYSKCVDAFQNKPVPADGNFVRIVELAFNVAVAANGDLELFGASTAVKVHSQIKTKSKPLEQEGVKVAILPIPSSPNAMIKTVALACIGPESLEIIPLRAIATSIPELHMHYDYETTGIPDTSQTVTNPSYFWTNQDLSENIRIAGIEIATNDLINGAAIDRVCAEIPGILAE